jgi:hypothetical protein
MLTCGDIGDGKPCWWHGKAECERHQLHAQCEPVLAAWANDQVCEQVLVLCRVRKEKSILGEARDRLAKVVEDQNAEAARLKGMVLDGIRKAGERLVRDVQEKARRMMAGEEE